MALILDKDHFDYETKDVGRIRIRSYTMGASGEFGVELSKRVKTSSVDLVRKLVSIIGRCYDKTTGEIQPKNLQPETVKAISDEEIEEIARMFVEKNDWLYKDIENPKYEIIESEQGERVKKVSYEKKEIPREQSETYSEYLIRLIRSYEVEFSSKMSRLGSPFDIRPKMIEQLKRSSAFYPQAFFSRLSSFQADYSPISSLQSTVRELAKTSNLPTVLMANAANASILNLQSGVSRLTDIMVASTVMSKVWREQLSSINSVFGTDRLFKEQIQSSLSDMAGLSFTAETTLAKLQRDSIGSLLKLSGDSRSSLFKSTLGFTNVYSKLFESFEGSIEKLLSLPPVVSKFPPIEFFLDTELLESISIEESEEIAKQDEIWEELADQTKESLEIKLSALNVNFLDLYKGAKQALNSDNADRIRHFTTSLRELFTQVLHCLTPDEDLRKWDSSPDNFHNGRPTRKARLRFICRTIDYGPFTAFLDTDIKSVVALLDIFQRGTHGVGVSFSESQLETLLLRIEQLLIFLIQVNESNK